MNALFLYCFGLDVAGGRFCCNGASLIRKESGVLEFAMAASAMLAASWFSPILSNTKARLPAA